MVIPSVVDMGLYLPLSGDRHPGEDRVNIGWIGSDPNRSDLAPMKPVFDSSSGDSISIVVASTDPPTSSVTTDAEGDYSICSQFMCEELG